MRHTLSHAWHYFLTACLRLEPGYIIRVDLTGQLFVFYSLLSVSMWVGVCVCAQDLLGKQCRVGGPQWAM